MPQITDAIRQGSLFEQPTPTDPPPPKRPFRLEPHTATPDELASLNEAEGHKGARRYLRPERAASMARKAKSAVDTRLASWIHHPDEHVPIALLDNTADPKLWKGSRHDVPPLLLERAVRSAEDEGVAWTPLLDVLADRGRWPHAHRGYGRPSATDLSDLEEADLPYHREHRLRQLITWVEAQTDPREVEALLDFRYDGVAKLVAHHTPCLDVDLLDRLLESPRRAANLARNPHLDRDHVDHLIAWARQGLLPDEEDQPEAGERRGTYGAYRRRRTSGRSGRPAQAAASALTELKRQGHAIGDELVAELVEVVSERDTARRSNRRRSRRTHRTKAFEVLTHKDNDELTPDQLLTVYDAVANDSRQVRSVITHPKATVEVWRHVARDSSLFKVRDRMTRIEEAIADPEVREILSATSSADVLERLAGRAGPEEIDGRLSDLTRADAAATLRLVTSGNYREPDGPRNTEERPIEHIGAVDRERHFVAAFQRLRTRQPDTALEVLTSRKNRWVELLNAEEDFRVAFRHLIEQKPCRAWARMKSGDLEGRGLDAASTFQRVIRSILRNDDVEDTVCVATMKQAPDDLNAALTEREYGPLLEQDLSMKRHVDLLLAVPALRRRPEHEETIRERGGPAQRARFCRYLEGDDLAETFRELATDSVSAALDLLEDDSFEGRHDLPPSSLMPLLRSSDQDVRTRAIFVAGELDLDRRPEAAEADLAPTPGR